MSDFFASQTGELAVLALSAFLSATLLPGGSEAVLILVVTQGTLGAAWPVIVAGVGNTLGGLTTYGLGRWCRTWYESKHGAPASGALAGVRRWGASALLFSWLPVMGDALCLAAGWLKISLPASILTMWVGKTLRYALLAYLSLQI